MFDWSAPCRSDVHTFGRCPSIVFDQEIMRAVVPAVQTQLSGSRGNDGRTRNFSGRYGNHVLHLTLSAIRKAAEALRAPVWAVQKATSRSKAVGPTLPCGRAREARCRRCESVFPASVESP